MAGRKQGGRKRGKYGIFTGTGNGGNKGAGGSD